MSNETGRDPQGVSDLPPQSRKGPTSHPILFGVLVSLGSVTFFIAAYVLTHLVEGLPRAISAGFAFVTLASIALSILIAVRVFEVFQNTRAGQRGARMHRWLMSILSLVAVLPAIVAFGLTGTVLRAFSDEYFVERVTEANLVARDLANGYANAESRKMGVAVFQLVSDLARQSANGLAPETAPIGFRRYLLGQIVLRNFSAVVLLDDNGQIVTEVAQRPDMHYRLPPREAFEDVSAPGAVPYIFNAHDQETIDAYYALLKLGPPDGGYLIAYKDENPALSEQLVRVRDFRDETTELRSRLGSLTVMFTVGYGLVMILLLLGAVWIGLMVANRIVEPVSRLAIAAEGVSQGDLSSRVDVHKGDGELGDLGHTFNEMTRQLEAQRADLIAAHEQSDARRRFIETVVSGVPAGVLNVAKSGRIALANPSAEEILGKSSGRLVGRDLAELAPELWPVLKKAGETVGLEYRDQIELHHRGVARIINVRVSPDDPERQSGFVITLDDITELVSAQRNAAWGDVARRIAHEIKNPLTPIQLSAERLKRKYGKVIVEDREIFDRCTDTIIRHVGDIGHMVNEFSSFARMPEPVMAEEDLRDIARSAMFSFGVANPKISFEHDMPEEPVMTMCDGRLIGQAVVNLVKNATEAISEQNDSANGRIVVHVRTDDAMGIIEVQDNGKGLPQEGRARLTEPYMTTRQKGTGLGLAIVRKAVEEHGGTFELVDSGVEGGPGATARISLPLTTEATQIEPSEQEQEA